MWGSELNFVFTFFAVTIQDLYIYIIMWEANKIESKKKKTPRETGI